MYLDTVCVLLHYPSQTTSHHSNITVNLSHSSDLLNSYLPDVEFFCGHRFESGADIPLKAFHQSVRNDIMAAKGVTDNLNPNKLREFVKALDECQGQILISGIGERMSFSLLVSVCSLSDGHCCIFALLYNVHCLYDHKIFGDSLVNRSIFNFMLTRMSVLLFR